MKYKLLKTTNDPLFGFYDYGGSSTHSEIWWALCGAPKVNGTIKQLTGFIFCRESLSCRLFERMSTDPERRNRRGAAKIPIDRLRLLAKTSTGYISPSLKAQEHEKFKVRVKAALKILNIIEREHKWALTVAHPIKPYSNVDCIYLFVASKKWMRSPHLLSLFTLLIRLAQQTKLNNDTSFKRVRTYKGLLKKLKEYSEMTSHNPDKVTVKQTKQFWDPLLRNYQKLYRGMSMKRNFDNNKYSNYYDEGLRKLCRGSTGDMEMRLRFKKMIKGE